MVDLADLDDSYAEWIRAFVHARRYGD
jgi:hypothetical protein